MSITLLIPIICFSVVGVLAVLLLIGVLFRKIETAEQKEIRKLKSLIPQKGSKNKQRLSLGTRMYPVLDRMLGASQIQNNIRSRLTSIHVGEEAVVREKSAYYTVAVLAGLSVFVLLAIFYAPNIYSRMSFIGAGLYASSLITDYFVGKMQKKSMHAQDALITDLRDKYHESWMVRESLERSSEELNTDSAIHARKICNIIEAVDSETELYEYYQVAPNKHMKQLAGLSYKVFHFGEPDHATSENSVYLSGLTKIQEDLRMDITHRQNLDYGLSGTTFMALFPIFFVEPAKNWVISNFSQVETFYSTKLGFYSMVVIYLTFLVSFVAVRFFVNLANTENRTRIEGRFASYLLDFRFVKTMISRIAPVHKKTLKSAKLVEKTEKLLTDANSQLSIHQFYVQRILAVIAVFVLVLFVQTNVHTISKKLMADEAAYSLQPKTSVENTEKQRRVFEADTLKALANKGFSKSEMQSYISYEANGKKFAMVDGDFESYVDYMVSKVMKYQSETFKWYDLLLAIFLGGATFWLPNGSLYLKSVVRKWDMQGEVDGFLTIVSILSRIENIMVYEILEWMHRYSSIFSPQLMKCISNYESGSWQALEEFKDSVRFPPLVRIINRLQNAVSNIEVKDAFSDLEGDRMYALEQRKFQNQKAVVNRTKLANALGWAPLVVLGLLYIVLPFAIFMVQQFGEINTTFSSIGG